MEGKRGLWSMLVVVMMIMIVVEGSRVERQASRCNSGSPCIPLSSCTTFQRLLRNPTREVLRQVQRAMCNRDRRNPKVCCPGGSGGTSPTPTPTPTPTPNPGNGGGSGEGLLPSKCSTRIASLSADSNQAFVHFGQNARLGRLPWVAALGYDSTTQPRWACGGSLINDRYVLTAAHCIHSTYTFGSKLTVVRLGEYNIETATDCEVNEQGVRRCAPAPQDYTPAQTIIHPTFDDAVNRVPLSDDIALVRLDRRVTFTDYIQPVCLPPAGAHVTTLLKGSKGEVAGWGLTETGNFAKILQSALLPYIDRETCAPHYVDQFIDGQICFGGEKEDSCQGDSGGPLMVNANSAKPLVIGVVSRGKTGAGCGTIGAPAIYAEVAAYRNWIVSNLKP